MRLVLLGPPGAGKGTQATRLSAEFGVPHISTGDIFRRNMAERTPLGLEAQGYVDRGDYVPDDVVNRMVADRLAQPDAAEGFLLDGYPRTVAQAEQLDLLLAARRQPLTAALRFVLPEEEFMRRLRGRQATEGRSDDTEEAWRRRLEEYRTKTLALDDFYAARGLLRDVDALGPIEEVTKRAIAALPPTQGPSPQGPATA